MNVNLILFAVLAFVSGQAFSSQERIEGMREERDSQEEGLSLCSPIMHDPVINTVVPHLSLKDLRALRRVSSYFNEIGTDALLRYHGIACGLKGLRLYQESSQKSASLWKAVLVQEHALQDENLKILRHTSVVVLKDCHQITNLGLSALKEVESLSLLDCAQIGPSCLPSLIYTPLSELIISGWDYIISEDFSVFEDNLKSNDLTRITLEGCRAVKVETFSDLPRSLEEMTISDAQELSFEEGVRDNITSLDLSGGRTLTTRDPDFLGGSLPLGLKRLSLARRSDITNKDLKRLAKKGPVSLLSLNLSGCPNISNKGYQAFVRKRWRGLTLNLSRCKPLKKKTRKLLEKNGVTVIEGR